MAPSMTAGAGQPHGSSMYLNHHDPAQHARRVWDLDDQTLGFPVAVLAGHQGIVAYLDFSPLVPEALLSASFDGSVRLWNARDAETPAVVLRPGPGFALQPAARQVVIEARTRSAAAGAAVPAAAAAQPQQPQPQEQEQEHHDVLCCAFSPCSSFLVAGCNDCHVYLWSWDVGAMAEARGGAAQVQPEGGAGAGEEAGPSGQAAAGGRPATA
jgi:WD40 repeat protein